MRDTTPQSGIQIEDAGGNSLSTGERILISCSLCETRPGPRRTCPSRLRQVHRLFLSPQQQCCLTASRANGCRGKIHRISIGVHSTGIPFQVYVNFSDPEGFAKSDTLNLYIGTPTVVFADSASNGTGNWTTGQGWGTTSNAHSAPSAFTDSPSGKYHTNANNPLTLINQLSLTGYNYAQLKFWTEWSIEPTWDFATVEVSTNNGSTWTTLRTTTSTRGSGRSGGQQPTT